MAKSITADGIERLRAMTEAMRVAAQSQDLEQYAQLNLQFHDILVDTAGIKELSLFRMRALGSSGLHISADEHREIVDAIASGDPERAGRTMRRHVADSRERMHKAFGRAPQPPQAPTPTSLSTWST